jgi:acetyl esterase
MRDPATLDPDIRRLLDTVFSAPAPDSPDVARLRAAAEAAPVLLGGPATEIESVRDAAVDGFASQILLRIYRPASARALPLVLYAHGGGWVTGSLDSHDKLCRMLADRLAAVVVAVDYRLAPEHVFPSALDDFEAAWLSVSKEARALGADGERFVFAGDSSGGNLAAGLTLRLRAKGARQPRAQLLLYPALDATRSRASYRDFATGYNLSGEQMAWYWNAYRGGANPEAPELSPLLAKDLEGLPPALIAAAGADVLRDEAVDYAQRLRSAGVEANLVDCHGMIHGFLRWTGEVAAARRWIDAIAATARTMIEASPT